MNEDKIDLALHGENMELYFQDWRETAEPWKRWELRRDGNKYPEWRNLDSHPRWLSDTIYRRKKRFVQIGAYEVPVPDRSNEYQSFCLPFGWGSYDDREIFRQAIMELFFPKE